MTFEGHEGVGEGGERRGSAAAAADAPPPVADATERLDAVASLLKGWVWETDAQHRFVFMSGGVEQFGGRRPEVHYGKTLGDLGILTAVSQNESAWSKQLDAREKFGPVDFVRYDQGRPFFMRALGQPRFDTQGNFTGYIGIAFATPDGVATEAEERRRAERQRTARIAEVVVPNQSAAVLSAVLVDISATGARLRVPDDVRLPDAFELSVEALGLHRRCVVRWQANNEVGVAFLA